MQLLSVWAVGVKAGTQDGAMCWRGQEKSGAPTSEASSFQPQLLQVHNPQTYGGAWVGSAAESHMISNPCRGS